jgi:hypothetical protein
MKRNREISHIFETRSKDLQIADYFSCCGEYTRQKHCFKFLDIFSYRNLGILFAYVRRISGWHRHIAVFNFLHDIFIFNEASHSRGSGIASNAAVRVSYLVRGFERDGR